LAKGEPVYQRDQSRNIDFPVYSLLLGQEEESKESVQVKNSNMYKYLSAAFDKKFSSGTNNNRHPL
jgi:hypothetical protein